MQPTRKQNSKPIRVFVADGQTLFREGIRRLIDKSSDIIIVGEASNGAETVAQVSTAQPDILILDFDISKLGVFDVLQRIAPLRLQTLILAEAIKPNDMTRAARFGVSAILLKQSPFTELIKCIRLVGTGGTWTTDIDAADSSTQSRVRVTKREAEILTALASGCSNKEIARSLQIGERTVKHYIQNLFNKTKVSNRVELLSFAVRNGLIDETHLEKKRT